MTAFRKSLLIGLITVLAAAMGAAIALFGNTLTASAATNYNTYTYNGYIHYTYNNEGYVDSGSYGQYFNIIIQNGSGGGSYTFDSGDYFNSSYFIITKGKGSVGSYAVYDINLTLTRVSDGEIITEKNGATTDEMQLYSGTLSDGEYNLTGYYTHLPTRNNTTETYTINITFYVDATSPTVTLNGAANSTYYNTSVTVKASDSTSGVSSLKYSYASSTFPTSASTTFSSGKTFTDEGCYYIVVTDKVGNTTTVKFAIYSRDGFGNQENIKSSYTVSTWYEVTLSSKYYSGITGKEDIAGTYSFATYDAALEWAAAMEREYHTSTTANGWRYVSKSNRNVYVEYTDENELEEVIYYYAEQYVSSRKTLSAKGNTISNQIDDLTAQNLVLPSALSAKYSGLSVYLIQHDYTFVKAAEGVSGNTVSVKFTFIYDGISVQSDEITLGFGDTVYNLLDEANKLKQGYYLVTESDLCGNIEQYIVYIDLAVPTVTAEVEKGDGTTETIEFTEDYTATYAGLMAYIGFNVTGFLDNIDEYVMLNIDGRNIDSVTYVAGDEIPYLSYDNGYYGKYTITVYDRSLNALTFTITIAGAAPTISHSSLTSETRLKLTITLNDSNSAITSIKIYKVTYLGEYEELTEDGAGNPVSAETLLYYIYTGGKYVVVVTDSYGRTVTSDALFYMKGLPSGTLSGVKEGGVTNSDVTFTYENTNSIIVYAYINGEWQDVTSEYVTITSNTGYSTATIEASVDSSYEYKIFLYVTDEMNLYVEYLFEIDCIAPSVTVMTDGGEIGQDSVTRESFYITWSETGLTAYYYNSNSTLGSYNKSKYTKGTVISSAGNYVFEIYDAAGNVTKFEVLLDNTVSYTLEGTYTILEDGSYISSKYITLTVSESTSVWQVVSTNSITPLNGQKLNEDGTYTFYIVDLYGNELSIVIIIDTLPPEPVITTASGEQLATDSETNESFFVSCEEENVTIYWKTTKSGNYTVYNGSEIADEGVYYFKMVDRMGNYVEFTVEINKTVSYTVKGTYVQYGDDYYVTNKGITISAGEELADFDYESDNGVEVELGVKITEEGVYTLYLTDNVGNVIVVTVVVDYTAPVIALNGAEDNGTTSVDVTVNIADYESAYYTISGSSVKNSIDDGFVFDEEGTYTITATDIAGNTSTVTFTVDKSVDVTISPALVNGQYVAGKVVISINEKTSAIVLIKDGVEVAFTGGTLSEEGVYSLTITDLYGNTVQYSFTIIAAAASYYSFELPEGYSAIVTKDGSLYTSGVNGRTITLAVSGTYTITIYTGTGSYSLTLTVDAEAPTVELLQEKTQVTIVSVSKDNATLTLTKDGKTVSCAVGQTLTDVGSYVLTATDEYGNSTVYEFTLNYINAYGVAVIVVVVIIVIAIVVVTVVMRRRQRIR